LPHFGFELNSNKQKASAATISFCLHNCQLAQQTEILHLRQSAFFHLQLLSQHLYILHKNKALYIFYLICYSPQIQSLQIVDYLLTSCGGETMYRSAKADELLTFGKKKYVKTIEIEVGNAQKKMLLKI